MDRIAELERGIARDVGRNIAPLAAAARSGLWGAAESLTTIPDACVLVLTGCFIPAVSAPETDGPPGAAALAAALARAGRRVAVVTDARCASATRATLGVVSASVAHGVVDDGLARVRWDGGTMFPLDQVTHAIAVERLGPGCDRRIRGMRGDDRTHVSGRVHELFAAPVTIGIGDGGNELGMGSVPHAVVAGSIANGDRIHCRVPADHLIVAGVSNWGAYGLIAALAVRRPGGFAASARELLGEEADAALLQACVRDGGAVDGVTGRPEQSVDGVSAALHYSVVRNLPKYIP